MDLDKAISAHAEWKTKFRAAISKKERMDVSTIAKDNCCELGKWLHGDGAKQFSANQRFAACRQKHADFHREAGKVAQAINDGKLVEAEAMLNSGTAYGNASNEVGAAVIQLKRALVAAA